MGHVNILQSLRNRQDIIPIGGIRSKRHGFRTMVFHGVF